MSFEGFTSALWAQLQVLGEGLSTDLGTLSTAMLKAVPFLIAYVVLVLLCMTIWRFIRGKFRRRQDFTALKTVTFGDESAVRAERAGSVISIAVIFLAASLTLSKLQMGPPTTPRSKSPSSRLMKRLMRQSQRPVTALPRTTASRLLNFAASWSSGTKTTK